MPCRSAAAAALGFSWWLAEGSAQQTQPVEDKLAPEHRLSCARNTSDPKVSRFCGWLEDQCHAEGLGNIFFAGFEHGGVRVRGLGAARDVETHEEIFCVPQPCWFVTGQESERVKVLTEGCQPDHVLAIHIAEELSQGNDSFFAPFLDMLPDAAMYGKFHPAFLEADAAKTLGKFSNYWPYWSQGMVECYERYKEIATGNVVSSQDAYAAFVLLLSRRFGGVDMPPLLDMVNVATRAELNVRITYASSRSSDRDEAVCITATRDILRDEELLVDYGAADHSAMLMFAVYGFALAPESHDPLKHEFPSQLGVEVDPCIGLRDLEEPDPESHPVYHNFWRFAQVHCRGAEAASGRSPPLAAAEEAPSMSRTRAPNEDL